MVDPKSDTGKANAPLKFEQVLAEEVAAGCSPPGESLGLAFSGGGIRSATFNLGVIQALAKLNFLRHFDYLSTISGGGYIGAWLSTFIKRIAHGDVAQAEAMILGRESPPGNPAISLENPAIRFLRSFSNYLTPRMGMSMDTLVAVATYLRNLLLNLCILLTLVGALMILPRVAGYLRNSLIAWDWFRGEYHYEIMMVVLLMIPAFMVALNLFYRAPGTSLSRPWFMNRWLLVALVDLPVVAAAFVAVAKYLLLAADGKPLDKGEWFESILKVYALLWGLCYFLWLLRHAIAWIYKLVLALVGRTAKSEPFPKEIFSGKSVPWYLTFIFFAFIAGAVGAGILIGIGTAIQDMPAHREIATLAFGPPAVVSAFMLILVAHIGLMGRLFGEPDRELWSVFGARLTAIVIAWTVIFGIALYGPAALGWANEWIVGLGGGAWIASTLFGVFAAKGDATGKEKPKGRSEFLVDALTRIAPYIFVLGLLISISWGVHRGLHLEFGPALSATAMSTKSGGAAESGVLLRADPVPGAPVVTVREPGHPSLWDQFKAHARAEYPALLRSMEHSRELVFLLLAGLAGAAAISWRVNINLFSLHHFYRNRLTRCYLGATNKERRPHPLTGFDPNDDPSMMDLKQQKPFHIVGTAINLNRGAQLAWQNRRAASFTFTSLHAGYEPASTRAGTGYRRISEYGKDAEGKPLPLGTAIAISGAAASPNMGYHTSAAVAFLLTVFNVRLGHWCGDPGDAKAWRERDPSFSLRYWLAELTGSAGQGYPFVSLSDGGHFENLGIYELVRRRCKLIVACDAGADPDYSFEDLAEAIRKCYTDFGVEIKFGGDKKIDDLRPQGENLVSKRHYAIGEIKYPGRENPGTLIYLKSSLTDDLPADIMHYRRTHKDFPHETTADQFFDEAQFESYRKLGYEAALRSFGELRDDGELPPQLDPQGRGPSDEIAVAPVSPTASPNAAGEASAAPTSRLDDRIRDAAVMARSALQKQ
jgi:hypothetical protein